MIPQELLLLIEMGNKSQLCKLLVCVARGGRSILFLVPNDYLLRRKRLREMFRVRALWGTLTDKNNPFKSNNPDLFRFPTRDGKFTSFVMDPKVPYVEASVGIYNIFKLLHVEYVHRFTYRDNPGINKNGIRFMVLMVF